MQFYEIISWKKNQKIFLLENKNIELYQYLLHISSHSYSQNTIFELSDVIFNCENHR